MTFGICFTKIAYGEGERLHCELTEYIFNDCVLRPLVWELTPPCSCAPLLHKKSKTYLTRQNWSISVLDNKPATLFWRKLRVESNPKHVNKTCRRVTAYKQINYIYTKIHVDIQKLLVIRIFPSIANSQKMEFHMGLRVCCLFEIIIVEFF